MLRLCVTLPRNGVVPETHADDVRQFRAACKDLFGGFYKSFSDQEEKVGALIFPEFPEYMPGVYRAAILNKVF